MLGNLVRRPRCVRIALCHRPACASTPWYDTPGPRPTSPVLARKFPSTESSNPVRADSRSFFPSVASLAARLASSSLSQSSYFPCAQQRPSQICLTRPRHVMVLRERVRDTALRKSRLRLRRSARLGCVRCRARHRPGTAARLFRYFRGWRRWHEPDQTTFFCDSHLPLQVQGFGTETKVLELEQVICRRDLQRLSRL